MGARQWMSPLSRFSRQSERTPAQIGQLRLRLLNPPRKVISLSSAAIGQNRTASSGWIGWRTLSAALSGGLDEVSALWWGRDARLEFDSQSLICGERRLQSLQFSRTRVLQRIYIDLLIKACYKR
jgi:hypothetical protein